MIDKAVLVGVDGSAGGARALDWAARDAGRRHVPLTVCFALTPAAADAPVLAQHRGAEVLAAAGHQLRAEWPELPVRTVLGDGYPSTELLRRSAGHQLVVVGSRGDSGLAEIVLGSVAAHLATHARCPIVVVPPSRVDPLAPVLVGVDGSELNRPAVEHAFTAADRAGVGVVALSSLDTRRSALGFGGGVPADRLAELAHDAVGLWSEKYPHMPVEHRVVSGPPAAELVTASAGASLTVVGSRGHGAMTARLLGSVSHRVVHHAKSPIAVVRDLAHGP